MIEDREVQRPVDLGASPDPVPRNTPQRVSHPIPNQPKVALMRGPC